METEKKLTTELVIHWENLKHNFVNKEQGLSSKHRLGHKPNTLSQTTPIVIQRGRLDTKFKTMLTNELNKHSHLIRKDMRAVVFINGTRYNLSIRDKGKFANNLTNILIKEKRNGDKNSLDKLITIKK